MKKLRLVWAIWAAGAILSLASCAGKGSDSSDPKEVVIAVFGAMEKDDKASLAHLLDLAELMKNTNQDYALTTDQPRTFTNPQQVLDDLTGEGLTKQRWFAMQRIVNKSEVLGETATVEVTFVDKKASKGYRTLFGLHRVNDKWRVYSFKTVQ